MPANPTPSTTALRRVARTIRGIPASDGGGVRMTRVIGSPSLPRLDPFLMLDEFRSADAADYIAGFPDHPHRGFQTVTYMLAGRMRHGDHLGNTGLLEPGGAQWMTAGRGIIHSEMPEQEDGLMWGFQLWINLAARDKMVPPSYRDLRPEAIPERALPGGGLIRVLAGQFDDVEGPISVPVTEPVFLDVALKPGGAVLVPLPAGHAAFAYVFDGTMLLGEGRRETGRGELALLEGDGELMAEAGAAGGRMIVVAGRPIGEPIVQYGPFVMNTEAEIRQAIDDFRAGRF